jgi:hypothetical protein
MVWFRYTASLVAGWVFLPVLLCGAEDKPLAPQERHSIKKIGVAVSARDTVSCNVSVPSVNPGYYPMFFRNQFPSFGSYAAASLAGAAIGGLIAGARQAAIREAAEGRMNEEVSEALGEWSFRRAFANTFLQTLSRRAGFSVEELAESVSRKDGRSQAESLGGKEVDALLHVNVERYGLRSQKEGFAVYVRAKVEATKVSTGKSIASCSVHFDTSFGQPEPQVTTGGVTKTPKPDPEFHLPITVGAYDSFLANNAQLLKRDLKLAALLVSRSSLGTLGVVDEDRTAWQKECRRRPTNWTAQE